MATNEKPTHTVEMIIWKWLYKPEAKWQEERREVITCRLTKTMIMPTKRVSTLITGFRRDTGLPRPRRVTVVRLLTQR